MIGDKLQYALKDNTLVSIDQVEKGLACNCVCPACKSQLVARKGEKREHHFAHYKNNSCATGYQTSLHLLAKELIQEKRMIKIPPVNCDIFCLDSNEYEGYSFVERQMREEKLLENVEVTLEEKENGIIPDIIIQYENYKLYVEIFVTHKVDDNKIKIVKENDIPMMEIDLSREDRMISIEDLSYYLFEDTSNSYWINNRYQNQIDKETQQYIQDFLKKREIKKQKEEQERQNKIRSSFEKALCPHCSAQIVKYRNRNNLVIYICSKDCDIRDVLNDEYISILREKLAHTTIYNYQQLKVHNGQCPRCTQSLTILNGRYGPYITCTNSHCHPKIDYELRKYAPEELLHLFYDEKNRYEQSLKKQQSYGFEP